MLRVSFSFDTSTRSNGKVLQQDYYVNGKLFHPTESMEYVVDGIPSASNLAGNTLSLELVKANNNLFLVGRNPQAQIDAGSASSGGSSSVPTSQE